jgi:hypothetical protein
MANTKTIELCGHRFELTEGQEAFLFRFAVDHLQSEKIVDEDVLVISAQIKENKDYVKAVAKTVLPNGVRLQEDFTLDIKVVAENELHILGEERFYSECLPNYKSGGIEAMFKRLYKSINEKK